MHTLCLLFVRQKIKKNSAFMKDEMTAAEANFLETETETETFIDSKPCCSFSLKPLALVFL